MISGPGKYDNVLRTALEITKARGIIVVIIDGGQGTEPEQTIGGDYPERRLDYEVQGPLDVTEGLPDLLESLANHVRRVRELANDIRGERY